MDLPVEVDAKALDEDVAPRWLPPVHELQHRRHLQSRTRLEESIPGRISAPGYEPPALARGAHNLIPASAPRATRHSPAHAVSRGGQQTYNSSMW